MFSLYKLLRVVRYYIISFVKSDGELYGNRPISSNPYIKAKPIPKGCNPFLDGAKEN